MDKEVVVHIHNEILHMCVCVCVPAQSLSHVRLVVTPWTVARQAALSMEFSRHVYWSGLPLPSPTSYLKTHID